METRQMILVAEDTMALRLAMVEYLRRQGWTVVEAPDGLKALELVERHPTELYALITDFDMPKMDGLQLIKRAADLCPRLRVLLVTSRLPAEMSASAIPIEVLHKPFELSELTDWLSHAASQAPRNSDWTRVPRPSGQARSSVAETGGERWRRVRPWLSVVAASMLLTLAVWARGHWLDRGAHDGLPAPPTQDVLRSLTIQGLGPLGVMSEVPERWTWQAVPGAVRYEVSVMDITDQTVWQAETTNPSIDLSPDFRARWPAHVAWFVSVNAFDAQRSTVALIGGQRIRVLPRPEANGETNGETQGEGAL